MIIDKILDMFPPEIRNSNAMHGLVALTQTFYDQLQLTQAQLQSTQAQLQSTQEQLTKALDKIKILEDEIAKLRKTPKRPNFRPNNMQPRNRDKGSSSDNPTPPANTDFPLMTKEISEIIISPESIPEGSRYKGFQPFTVQELSIIAKEITYKLEVWETPTGEILHGKLPVELQGQHYGPALRALETNLYAQGMTQPAIHEFLTGLGIDISTGQVNNILLNEAEDYSKVSEAILTVGLKEASYIRTDDTGEKHQHKSSYCTHIGGKYFSYYTTSFSKSRENFLRILLQGKEGYHINDAMIWHLFQSGVKDDVLNLFEEHRGKVYRSRKGMNRLLNELDLNAKKIRQQCMEAGLVGFITDTILKPGQILLSDRAGQFALFDHAGCWVHMERPLRKIICSSPKIELQLEKVRNAIWTLYRALKEAALTQVGKEAVHQLYDDFIEMKTDSEEINAVISNFKTYRDELLKALDHPGLPLHNNDSERDIRPVAKRRNISGSTKNERGRKFRDGLMSIKQTCFRVGYNFWDYLQRWHRGDPPDLPGLVRNRYRASTS
jgi:hypothetical protein